MSWQEVAAAKAALRTAALRRRKLRAQEALAVAGEELAQAATDSFVAGGGDVAVPPVVALFLSGGGEPPTGGLARLFDGLGSRIIVPVLRPDGDLDWAAYRPGAPVVPGLRGTIEPAGARLGVEALRAAELVLVPALAVDRRGTRLGRGGGGYDRALPRRNAVARTLAIVFDEEVVDALPAAPHDQPVDGALTPRGLRLVPDPPTAEQQ